MWCCTCFVAQMFSLNEPNSLKGEANNIFIDLQRNYYLVSKIVVATALQTPKCCLSICLSRGKMWNFVITVKIQSLLNTANIKCGLCGYKNEKNLHLAFPFFVVPLRLPCWSQAKTVFNDFLVLSENISISISVFLFQNIFVSCLAHNRNSC